MGSTLPIPTAFLDFVPHMPEAEVKIILAIFRMAGPQGDTGHMSLKELAKASGISITSVRKGLALALSEGFVQRTPDKDAAGRTAFTYAMGSIFRESGSKGGAQ